jgi:hypothetical protein
MNEMGVSRGTDNMSDDIRNSRVTSEDTSVQEAEQQFASPQSLNMQFLQSSLSDNSNGIPPVGLNSFTSSAKESFPGSSSSGQEGQSIFPASSGTSVLGAMSSANLGSAAGAIGMVSQVASAAPGAFGKSQVGESASLTSLGNRALAEPAVGLKPDASLPILKPVANPDGSLVPQLPEFAQLMAMLEGPVNNLYPDAVLTSLLNQLGENPSADNLDAAIDAVLDQINLLNDSFAPVFDELGMDVQSQVEAQQNMSTTDLGVSIFDDAGTVVSNLTDMLGDLGTGSASQLQGLLNLGTAFDGITSLLPPLPNLDISPITDPVIGIIDGVIGGITDPVTDIVGGVVGGITDPVTDIVDDVVGGITDPVTDIVDGVVDSIGLLSGLSSSQAADGDAGLLDTLSSGISSNAGSDSGLLGGVLGALDPQK